MTESEAFAAIALGAVACDGVLGKDEAHALRRQLEYRTPYKERSESEMAMLFDVLLKRLRESGLDQLVQDALPHLTELQQETALALQEQFLAVTQLDEAMHLGRVGLNRSLASV